MKKLFTKPFKKDTPTAPVPRPPSIVLPTSTHTVTAPLQPKFTLPPVPHPCPHEHIAIVANSEGLLLRPHLLGSSQPVSHIQIAWGKEGAIDEVQDEGESNVDWSESVIVYGLIGILNLFAGKLRSLHV